MRSVGFPHLAFHIARKDWAEARHVVIALTLGLMVPALLVRFAPGRSDDFAKGLLAGLLAGAGFGYAQFCFLNERQRGTLEFLLSLPIEPRQPVLAKFVSLYSMVLFTVNVPGLLVPDLRLVYITNAAALSLATVFMATTVISDKPWASQIPIWFLLVFILPIQRLLERYYPNGLQLFETLTANPILLATFALLVSPLVVAVSVSIFHRKGAKVNENPLSRKVIGAVIEVHRILGPGLLESIYQDCLDIEFRLRRIRFEREKRIPLIYKDQDLRERLRIDFLVADEVVIETKSVHSLLPVHDAQVLTYLKLTGCKLGLLINFNVPVARDGIKRIVNRL